MRKEDLPRIQKINQEILRNIIEICDRHHIDYFMVYGTLLGTIREGGPIPWDNDIDIGMTRENYMRFLEVAPGDLDPRNEINIMGSGSTKYLSELKIGRKNTWVYLEGTRDMNIMRQIQVDVFLFDYVRQLPPARKRFYEKIRKFLYITKLNWDEKRLIMMVMDEGKRRGRLFFKAGLVTLHVLRALVTEERIEQLMYEMFIDKTKKSGQMGIILENASSGGRVATWPVEMLTNLIEMNYADIRVKVPACYDQFLTDIYGDYMTPPPEDKRYRRHLDRFVLEINE